MLDITPDLCDAYADDVRLVGTTFQHFGQHPVFFGRAVTVKCFEDNSRVKELLATPGAGKVLVVDGGGSLNRALLGDMIALSAVENGWAGVVINGAIRDVAEINTMQIGVKALGSCPFKTDRRGLGETQVDIEINGTLIQDGDMIYADLNGILCAADELPLPGLI